MPIEQSAAPEMRVDRLADENARLRAVIEEVNRMAWSDDKTELRRIARLTDEALARAD